MDHAQRGMLAPSQLLPTSSGRDICTPPGSSWDGASIPRWAWSIMGHPLAADVREASYWHDRLCEGGETPEDRMVADAVFLMLLRRSGVSRWRRWAMWLAVRFYAVFIWRVKA